MSSQIGVQYITANWAAEGVVRRDLLRTGNSFLEKPYTVAALSDAVRGSAGEAVPAPER